MYVSVTAQHRRRGRGRTKGRWGVRGARGPPPDRWWRGGGVASACTPGVSARSGCVSAQATDARHRAGTRGGRHRAQSREPQVRAFALCAASARQDPCRRWSETECSLALTVFQALIPDAAGGRGKEIGDCCLDAQSRVPAARYRAVALEKLEEAKV
jgi:hypothetical protein